MIFAEWKPIDEIVEIDRLNMADFIEASGGKFDPERRRRTVKKEIEKGAIFILVNRANKLADYVEYWMERDETLNVASIQISSRFRNGSVLRELLSQAYDNLRKNPPSEAITSVHLNNRLSQKLNNKLGFKKIKEKEDRVYFKADGIEFLNNLARFADKQRKVNDE